MYIIIKKRCISSLSALRYKVTLLYMDPFLLVNLFISPFGSVRLDV